MAVELGNALVVDGHEVHLFARTSPLGGAGLRQEVSFHGLEGGPAPACARLDRSWSADDLRRFTDRVAAVVARHGLDVLHAHYADPFAVVADDVGRRFLDSAPAVVTTLHGTDVTAAQAESRRRRVGAALHRSHAVTTVSPSHARLATSVYRLASTPHIIPNFVDVGRFRPAPHLSRRRPARLVHVSNFRAVKDVEAVARVFLRVRRRLPAELWLVGDGETRPAVVRLLQRAGADSDVRLLGFHDRVDRLLPQCDVLLMMSHAESFCLAALEAGACGLPVVAPRVGGLPGLVVHERTGVLVAPRDETAAATAVLGLLLDERRRLAMGRAAAEHARNYSTGAVVDRYVALYGHVVRGVADGGHRAVSRRRSSAEPVGG